jgi:hypothetical protein
VFAIEKMPADEQENSLAPSEASEDTQLTNSEYTIFCHPKSTLSRSYERIPRQKARDSSMSRDEIEAFLIVERHPWAFCLQVNGCKKWGMVRCVTLISICSKAQGGYPESENICSLPLPSAC